MKYTASEVTLDVLMRSPVIINFNKLFATKAKLAAHVQICGKKQSLLPAPSAQRHSDQTDIKRAY